MERELIEPKYTKNISSKQTKNSLKELGSTSDMRDQNWQDY